MNHLQCHLQSLVLHSCNSSRTDWIRYFCYFIFADQPFAVVADYPSQIRLLLRLIWPCLTLPKPPKAVPMWFEALWCRWSHLYLTLFVAIVIIGFHSFTFVALTLRPLAIVYSSDSCQLANQLMRHKANLIVNLIRVWSLLYSTEDFINWFPVRGELVISTEDIFGLCLSQTRLQSQIWLATTVNWPNWR